MDHHRASTGVRTWRRSTSIYKAALLQPPVTCPPGRNIADTWLRDVGIAVMATLAVEITLSTGDARSRLTPYTVQLTTLAYGSSRPPH